MSDERREHLLIVGVGWLLVLVALYAVYQSLG
jgi:hypothetical protein